VEQEVERVKVMFEQKEARLQGEVAAAQAAAAEAASARDTAAADLR
jgi:hypothetical protein